MGLFGIGGGGGGGLKNPFKPTMTPQQGYAELDKGSQQLIGKSDQLANVPVSEIAAMDNSVGNLGTEALVDPMGGAQRQLALGGVPNDVVNDALAQRSQSVYRNQLNKLNLASQVGAYGKASERQGIASERVGRSEMIKQGMAQRQMEYDANRKAVRQQILSGLVNTGMSVGGYIAGKASTPGGGGGGGRSMDQSGMEMTSQIDSMQPMEFKSKNYGAIK